MLSIQQTFHTNILKDLNVNLDGFLRPSWHLVVVFKHLRLDTVTIKCPQHVQHKSLVHVVDKQMIILLLANEHMYIYTSLAYALTKVFLFFCCDQRSVLVVDQQALQVWLMLPKMVRGITVSSSLCSFTSNYSVPDKHHVLYHEEIVHKWQLNQQYKIRHWFYLVDK